MNNKKAKQLRKTAKQIYDVPTSYDDMLFKVDDPESSVYFMDGALAKRTLKQGTTRKLYQELKAGTKSKPFADFKDPKGFFKARKYRKA